MARPHDKKKIAFSTNSLKDHKALGIIDNFAKVVKSSLNKLTEDDKNAKWIYNIDFVVDNYNKTAHSSIGDNKPD